MIMNVIIFITSNTCVCVCVFCFYDEMFYIVLCMVFSYVSHVPCSNFHPHDTISGSGRCAAIAFNKVLYCRYHMIKAELKHNICH